MQLTQGVVIAGDFEVERIVELGAVSVAKQLEQHVAVRRVPACKRLDPFPREATKARLAAAARSCETLCRGRSGPKSMAVTVTWSVDGAVSKVDTGRRPHGESMSSAFCVRSRYFGLPPHSSPPATLTTAVSLP